MATANDGSFSNTKAIYPRPTLAAVQEFGAHEFLHLGVTYDGNSALLPALPLPLLEYEVRVDPSLRLRDAGRERIFYQLHTAEGGLRYANRRIDISLSGGWACSQELFTGYDLRERDQRVRPGDRPLVALATQGTF